MSEDIREEIEDEEGEETEEAEEAEEEKPEPVKPKKVRKKKEDNPYKPGEAISILSKGRIKLYKPFIADDEEIKELVYDFENLSGLEMAKAMDRGSQNGGNAFRITQEQALELFIASAGKETEGVDAEDVRRGLSSVDTVKAVQLAAVFFIASSQEGNTRITK